MSSLRPVPRRPRLPASSTTPQPVMPPPMTTRSNVRWASRSPNIVAPLELHDRHRQFWATGSISDRLGPTTCQAGLVERPDCEGCSPPAKTRRPRHAGVAPRNRRRLDGALWKASLRQGLADAAQWIVPGRPARSRRSRSCTTPAMWRPSKRSVPRRGWPTRPRRVGHPGFVGNGSPLRRCGAGSDRRPFRSRVPTTSLSPPGGHPAITPSTRTIGRWGSACSTTPQSGRRRSPKNAVNVWRSSTGTCTTATAPRTCSTTTRASCTCRPTSRRSTPAPGLLRETGAGDGVGANLNLPFPPGTAGDTFRAAFDTVVMPVIERFAPDWLIISAGFDAHRNDPLAGLELTSADFADMATRLKSLVPERRVVVVLEGGYDLEALTYGVGATLSALVGESLPAGAGVDRRDRPADRHRRATALGAVRVGGSGSAFLRCSDGHVRWGLYGAAGVVFVVRFPDGPRVMLQKRSAMAHEGGTWSCAGGALDHERGSAGRRAPRGVGGDRCDPGRPRRVGLGRVPACRTTGRTRRSWSPCRRSSGRRSTSRPTPSAGTAPTRSSGDRCTPASPPPGRRCARSSSAMATSPLSPVHVTQWTSGGGSGSSINAVSQSTRRTPSTSIV